MASISQILWLISPPLGSNCFQRLNLLEYFDEIVHHVASVQGWFVDFVFFLGVAAFANQKNTLQMHVKSNL